ncbi:uncharacterized protein LOC117325184 [Pecten maximus]|uniref:uncharacterized protein LOC117325184 n=1 Tax=Pecten maximus TaxID=6579 RepID=UPI001458AF13|nr:uncharacterized protein LOC117325184 [Pecten maximus]
MESTDRPDKWKAYYDMMLSKAKSSRQAIKTVLKEEDFLPWLSQQYPNIWFNENDLQTDSTSHVFTVDADLQWMTIHKTMVNSRDTINRYIELAKSYMEGGNSNLRQLQKLNSTSVRLANDFQQQRESMDMFYKEKVVSNLNHLSHVLNLRSEPMTSVISTFDKKCTTMYITKGIRKASMYLNMTVDYLSQYFKRRRILQTIAIHFDSNEMKYFMEEVRTYASGTFHNKEFSMESVDCLEMLLDEYYAMLTVYVLIKPAFTEFKYQFDYKHFSNIMPSLREIKNFNFEKVELLEVVLVLDEVRMITGEFKQSLLMNQQFYRDNFLHLNVLFHELRYDQLTQQIDYTIFALMGDIGGAMGLCIGASALSVFEIIDFVTVLMGFLMVKKTLPSKPRSKIIHVEPKDESKGKTTPLPSVNTKQNQTLDN